MPSKRVSVKLSEDEYALVAKAAAPGDVSRWLQELAVREAKAQIDPLDRKLLAKYGIEDARESMRELQDKFANDPAKPRARELLAALARNMFLILDQIERQQKLIDAIQSIKRALDDTPTKPK